MKKYYILIFIMLCTSTVNAAPTISDVSFTTFSHDSVAVVTGTDFGSKSPVAPFIYDKVYGNYPGLSNGDAIPTGGSNIWGTVGGSEGTPPVYRTTNYRGKLGACFSNNPPSNSGVGVVGSRTVTGCSGGILYASWWIYPVASNTSGSSKLFRFGDGDIGADSITYILQVTGQYDIYDGSYLLNNWNGPTFSNGSWHRLETVVTNSGSNHPSVQIWKNNVASGSGSASGVHPSICTAMVIGADWSNETSPPALNFGEIYLDNTLSRVEICNANTKAASNHCEIQIPTTSWSSTSLQITINQGSFADSSSAYLYVIDATGSVNTTGYAVTFGSSDSTPPTVTSASVNVSTVTVNFDETVVTTGYDSGDFNLDCTTSGTNISLSTPSGSGSTYTFTAATAVGYGDTCNLDYVGSTNDIEDGSGNDLAIFSDTTVTNNTPSDTTCASQDTTVCASAVFCTDFEEANWRTMWDDYDGNPAGQNDAITDVGPCNAAGNHVQKWTIPSGDVASVDLVKVLTTPPAGYDRLYLRWYQKFSTGFTFTDTYHGSGMNAGGREYLGAYSGYKPDGTDYFQGFLQAHSGTGIVSGNQINARPEIYTYYPGMYMDCSNPEGSCYGDMFPCMSDAVDGSGYCTVAKDSAPPWPPQFVADQWYCIELKIDAGTTGSTGSMDMWIDGTEYGSGWTGLNFRSTTNLKLDTLWMQHSYTGSHTGTPYILIDSIVASQNRVGCFGYGSTIPATITGLTITGGSVQ